jgi:hypothetical protein
MLSDFVKEIDEESGSIFSRLIEYNSFVCFNFNEIICKSLGNKYGFGVTRLIMMLEIFFRDVLLGTAVPSSFVLI